MLASTHPGDFVLDPFFGSGTVGVVARRLGRRYVGIELNPSYVAEAVSALQRPPLIKMRNGSSCATNGLKNLRWPGALVPTKTAA